MAYKRVNWKDRPNVNTPVDAEHLNIMDKGIADLDSQLAQTYNELNETKANKTDLTRQYIFKGSCTSTELASKTGMSEGDTWFIKDLGYNKSYTGESWDQSSFEAANIPEDSITQEKTSFIIYTIGDNIFDGQTRTGSYDVITGQYNSSGTSKCNKNKIQVDGKTTYYISDNGVAKNVIVFQYDSNGTLLVYANTNTFTTYENCAFINFYAGSLSNTIMISKKSDLTYKPYKRTYTMNNVGLSSETLQEIKSYVEENLSKSLTGKKVVNIGDSLWGNFEGANSLSGIIASQTGATTYNCGFGGCRMTKRTDNAYWDAFGMHALADAIVSGDWILQDTAIDNMPIGMPSYFSTHLATLKSINFSQIDILTIGFGVNDWMGGMYIDNQSNSYDKAYICGALRYSLEKLLTAYNNLRVVICSPMFAVWFDLDENVIHDSDSSYYNNSTDVTLKQVSDGLKSVAEEYHLKFCNVYDNLGLNKFTAKSFFDPTDGVHPNVIGRQKEGRMIAYGLIDL